MENKDEIEESERKLKNEIKKEEYHLYDGHKTAYDKSDKKTLVSFQLDKEKYYDLYYKVYDFASQNGKAEDENKALPITALNAAKLSVAISGFYLLQTAGLNESSECFEDIDKALQEVYDSFTGNSNSSV